MDFWHESAMPHNHICMLPDAQLGDPGFFGKEENWHKIPKEWQNAGECILNPDLATGPDDVAGCLTAVDIMSGRDTVTKQQRTRNSGCKNDGGPLWVSIDWPEDNAGPIGLGGFQTIYGRIFQKKSTAKVSRRSRRSSRYAQVGDYPTEGKSDLTECFAL